MPAVGRFEEFDGRAIGLDDRAVRVGDEVRIRRIIEENPVALALHFELPPGVDQLVVRFLKFLARDAEFLENHFQLAESGSGENLGVEEGRQRVGAQILEPSTRSGESVFERSQPSLAPTWRVGLRLDILLHEQHDTKVLVTRP